MTNDTITKTLAAKLSDFINPVDELNGDHYWECRDMMFDPFSQIDINVMHRL